MVSILYNKKKDNHLFEGHHNSESQYCNIPSASTKSSYINRSDVHVIASCLISECAYYCRLQLSLGVVK